MPLYEDYWLRKVGIDPQKYYLNTIRNNAYIAKAWEHQQLTDWERTRYISFSVYNTSFSMNGKPIFKKIKQPKDLFKLSTDVEEVLSAAEGEAFMKSLAK